MSRWDRPNLDAPHTQRELDEIPHGSGFIVPDPDHVDPRLLARALADISEARDEIASLKAQLADRDYRC